MNEQEGMNPAGSISNGSLPSSITQQVGGGAPQGFAPRGG
jgi:hypothetical protein